MEQYYYVSLLHTLCVLLLYIESLYIRVVLQLTPASSKWRQLCAPIPLLGQSTSLVSDPVHCTLSRRMAPVPWPKAARERACASVM